MRDLARARRIMRDLARARSWERGGVDEEVI